MLPASLWECFVPPDEASGDGLVLALALARDPAPGRWLWVQDRECIRLSGRPCRAGLPPPLRDGLIHVAARTSGDALWAMEEGVRCPGLSLVVGELAGDPAKLDFTASRRLVLTAERHGVPLMLLRRGGRGGLSAARLRWRSASAPSAEAPWNARAPGAPMVVGELFRARGLRTGQMLLQHGLGAGDDGAGTSARADAGHRLHLVSRLCDGSLAPELRQAG